jgi:hypothetical protein
VDSHLVSHEHEYSSSLRERVLQADGYMCCKCGATENLDVDHIRPIHHGGQSALENGRTLCQECHRHKTYYEEWIKVGYGSDVLGSLLSPSGVASVYYVTTKIWNATKERWERYGPFATCEEAWEWIEGRWLRPSR